MTAPQDFKPLENYLVKFNPYEYKKVVSLVVNPQLSFEMGNNFFINMEIHRDSVNLADFGASNYCTVIVLKKNSKYSLRIKTFE